MLMAVWTLHETLIVAVLARFWGASWDRWSALRIQSGIMRAGHLVVAPGTVWGYLPQGRSSAAPGVQSSSARRRPKHNFLPVGGKSIRELAPQTRGPRAACPDGALIYKKNRIQEVRRHCFSHGKSGVGIYVWGGERECKRERAMRAEGWQGCGGLARPCFSIFRAIIIPLIDICAHTSARRHFASNWIQESTYLLTPQIKNKNSTNFHSSVCTDSPGCISFARACLPIMTTNLVVSSHARK
jgi:hypothetical protein